MEVQFEEGENFHIPYHKTVKLRLFKKSKEVTYVSNRSNNLCFFKKLKGNKFLDTRTGEIRTYTKPNEFKSTKALKRTLNDRCRPLLENNFCGGPSEKFITLTFDNKSTKFKDLSRLYNNFWNKLTRYLKKQGLTLICIYVKETHSDYTWHIHALLKEVHHKTLFISVDKLKEFWSHGGVHINPVSSKVDYTDTEINIEEEMRLNLKPKTHSLNNLIAYMCKLRTKENVIPTSGRVYGKKGNLQSPKTVYDTCENIYKTELNNSHVIDEKTLLLRNKENGCIINVIHKEIWIEDKPNN